ncbi:hypothetical protein [Aureivirga sp. CE67]|uniref:hypothetical protein n=1 Tax=Aureivirga sp. CE67 TaxID=1788983 RepID=UPI0018C99F39|nr:hypothetical protein [Aureivirga sp. CE67]
MKLKNTLFILSFFCFNLLIFGQKTIHKDTKEISFLPKIETEQKLKYLVDFTTHLIDEETREINKDSASYHLNLTIHSIKDSLVNYSFHLSDFKHPAKNILYKDIVFEGTFNLKKRRSLKIKNYDEAEDLLKQNLKKAKKAKRKSITKEEYEFIKKYAKNDYSVVNISGLSSTILDPYAQKYSYERFKTDTIQSEDLLGNIVPHSYTTSFKKTKTHYKYISRKEMHSNFKHVYSYKEESSPDIEIFGQKISIITEFKINGRKIAPNNTIEFKQSKFKNIDLLFNTESGIIESFLYQEYSGWDDNQETFLYITFTLLE